MIQTTITTDLEETKQMNELNNSLTRTEGEIKW